MSGAIVKMLVDYETLVAAVREALPGKCPGWVNVDEDSSKIGCTVFKLRQDQLGDNLGEVKVRKVGDCSELSYEGSQRLPNRFFTQEEMDTLKAARPDLDFIHRCAELSRKKRKEGDELHRRREEHFDKVIQAMFNGLYNDVALQGGLQLMGEEGQIEPQVGSGTGRQLGRQGGTLERVKTARELFETGVPKTKACKRAHTDPRTYDRYAAEIIDWEDEDPPN